jgi:O-antigen/teichoic acid export membrane protein
MTLATPRHYLSGLSPARRATLNTLGIGLAVQAIIVISGVLAARILGPEDRGHLALYTLIAIIFVELGGLGLPAAVTYRIARAPQDARAIIRALAPTIACQIVLLFIVQAILMGAIFSSGPRAELIVAALVSLALVPSILIQRYSLAVLQGQQRFTWFNLLRITPPTFYSAAILALFLAGWHSLLAVTTAFAAGNVLAGMWALTVALRGLPHGHHVTRPRLRPMLSFGIRGMLGASNPVETFNLDQAAVGLALSPATLGLYVVGVSFTNLPSFIAKSVGIVAYPQVASQSTPADSRRTLWRFFWFNLALGLLVIVPLEFLSGWLVPFFFGNNFRGAVPITHILLVSGFLLASRRVLSDGLRGAGLPGLGSIAEIASWLVLLPLLPIFVTWNGAQGVASALVISSAFALLLLMALAHRHLAAKVSIAKTREADVVLPIVSAHSLADIPLIAPGLPLGAPDLPNTKIETPPTPVAQLVSASHQLVNGPTDIYSHRLDDRHLHLDGHNEPSIASPTITGLINQTAPTAHTTSPRAVNSFHRRYSRSAIDTIFVFTAAALVLGIIVPGFLTDWQLTSSPGAPGSVFLQITITAWAALRLAKLCARGEPRPFAIVFWLYVYIWLGLAGLLQVIHQTAPWPISISSSAFIKGQFLVLLGIAALEIGHLFPTRAPTHERTTRHIVASRVTKLVTFVLLIAPIWYQQLGGLHALFASRQELTTALLGASSSARAANLAAGGIKIAFATVPTFLALYLVIVTRQYREWGRWSRPIMVALVAVTIVLNSPISMPRFWTGTMLIALIFALPVIHRRAAATRLVVILFVFACIVLFPYAAFFRYSSGFKAPPGITQTLTTKPDYDSFEMISAGVQLSSETGFSYGAHSAGDLLFFIPRAVWTSKPQSTGALIATHNNLVYTNLSAPLWIEMYIDFGYIGIVLMFMLYGTVMRRADDRFVKGDSPFVRFAVPLVAGYSFILLRGALLPAMARLTVLLAIIWLISARSASRTSTNPLITD